MSSGDFGSRPRTGVSGAFENNLGSGNGVQYASHVNGEECSGGSGSCTGRTQPHTGEEVLECRPQTGGTDIRVMLGCQSQTGGSGASGSDLGSSGAQVLTECPPQTGGGDTRMSDRSGPIGGREVFEEHRGTE